MLNKRTRKTLGFDTLTNVLVVGGGWGCEGEGAR